LRQRQRQSGREREREGKRKLTNRDLPQGPPAERAIHTAGSSAALAEDGALGPGAGG